MSAFDIVIGYEDLKKELIMMCDVVKHHEKYKKLGVVSPRGVLLHGLPGVGKTLIASCFIEESGRDSIMIRKDKSDGEFVDFIRESFDKAKEVAPSIVFLDDLDKFAQIDEFEKNAEEYVVVQSCMDAVSDRDVFVIATANELDAIPSSLKRKGRFDHVINVEVPKIEVAESIMSFYLRELEVSNDVDVSEIARYMERRSCAELVSVINDAGIYAGYRGASLIEHRDIVKSCMRNIFNVPESCEEDGWMLEQRAAHEAGHAIVSEILYPGSVNMVSVSKCENSGLGLTSYRPTKGVQDYEHVKKNAIRTLSGKAAVEIVFGISDMGAKGDIDTTYENIRDAISSTCPLGFDSRESYDIADTWWTNNLQHKTSHEVESCYLAAKRLITENRLFLDAVMKELIEKSTLTYKDIARIKDGIYPV